MVKYKKMCGFAGTVKNSKEPVLASELEAMSACIYHRGPDDSGFYINESKCVGLASTRLAILDLSKNGHMPMVSDCGDFVISYNGEIYNHISLREQFLAHHSVHFKSTSDTETLLYLYKYYGSDCLNLLRGMFSFVIYDKKRNVLFGARDRIGQKPLKYFFSSDHFYFGSELKAFLQCIPTPVSPDFQAISDFLTFQYVPEERTGFQNIYKLPPAHSFELDIESWTFNINCYWSLKTQTDYSLSESDWIKEIRNAIDESVRMRLLSDVPVGLFLSGGLDSSIILERMSAHANSQIETFSIGFDVVGYDESVYARQVAALFNTNHHEFRITPPGFGRIAEIVNFFEEPFADQSMIAIYELAMQTRKHVTVALNGDGGDENFGGYNRYYYLEKARQIRFLPKWLLSTVANQLQRISEIAPAKASVLRKASHFFRMVGSTPAHAHMLMMYYFTDMEKRLLLSNNFYEEAGDIVDSDELLETWYAKYGFNSEAVYDRVDFHTYLPNDLLVKTDIATMAHSIEGRSPLLDHTLFELSARIPFDLKIKGREKKYILKKAFETSLPQSIVYRSKAGFSVPVDEWFTRQLREETEAYLFRESSFVSNYIDRDFALRMLRSKQATNGKIWLLIVIAMWYEKNFTK